MPSESVGKKYCIHRHRLLFVVIESIDRYIYTAKLFEDNHFSFSSDNFIKQHILRYLRMSARGKRQGNTRE